MTDPSKKSFVTEHAKELNLYPAQMSLVGKTGFINLDDDLGLSLSTSKSIKIIGAEINLTAPKIYVKALMGEINLAKFDPEIGTVIRGYSTTPLNY